MKWHSLGLGMTAKRMRRREFLDKMEKVAPRADLMALASLYLPEGKRGRLLFSSETMLCIRFMQQRFALSDPAMEEPGRPAHHDMQVFREFAGLEGWDERLPDESTILRFRHALDKHRLASDQGQAQGAKELEAAAGSALGAISLLTRPVTIREGMLVTKGLARRRELDGSRRWGLPSGAGCFRRRPLGSD